MTVTTRRQAASGAKATNGSENSAATTDAATLVEKAAKTWAATAGTGDRNSFLGLKGSVGYAVALMGTVFLMLACPAFVIYTAQIYIKYDGSIVSFVREMASSGSPHAVLSKLVAMWPLPSRKAWMYFGVFGVFEAALQLLLPGRTFHGPVTPMGNQPVYKANGVQAFCATLVAFFSLWWLGWWDPADVYDNFVEILSAANLFSLVLLAFLYIKGRVAPSSSDSGSTGNFIYDVFWGMELYPRIGKWFDIKMWTNCRMGMMSWVPLVLCFAAKQYSEHGSITNSMLVSVAVMTAYVFKFFVWEAGYMSTMDIAHDRAGYYLCWGCLNWVPGVYTSPALYLANHAVQLSTPVACAVLVAGLACVWINYDADAQRQAFRAKHGKLNVWGKPPKIIVAKYTTADGKAKESLLLASGWWGVSRHFHYVPEILASLFWTVPPAATQVLPYFYVVYLTLLLTDRLFRDDVRCKAKYGKYWDKYCEAVPYMLFPYVL